MTSAYDVFAGQFHDLMSDDPNARVALGLDRGLGELPDPSLEAGRDRARRAEDLLHELDGLDRAGLTFDQRLDLDLGRLLLERLTHEERLTFNGEYSRRVDCP